MAITAFSPADANGSPVGWQEKWSASAVRARRQVQKDAGGVFENRSCVEKTPSA